MSSMQAQNRMVTGFVGNGGRVILITAKADSLKEAQEEVYKGLSQLEWDGFFYRTGHWLAYI